MMGLSLSAPGEHCGGSSNAGITLVLVSARPPRTLRTMAEHIGASGLAICCNGALVYDLERAALVHEVPLAPALAQDLVKGQRVAVPGVCFAVEVGLRMGWEPAYAVVRPAVAQQVRWEDDALRLCTEPPAKLIACHADLPVETLLSAARAEAGERATTTHSGAPFIEMAAAGVDKAWALAALCSRAGIFPGEVIAFGDMPNDVPMLQWAGHSVAVANAHPEVVTHAREVTLSNEEDGVAVVLDRLLS